MADFSITGEVRLNSDPAQQSVSKWTVAAGELIADFVQKASSGLKEVCQRGLEYNASMESYLTNFTVMLGNEQLAAEKLEEIRKMAASTPFTLEDLTKGTQTLLQFGIAADDTTNVLKQLGDISLGNADKLQTLTRAYGKMASSQKVTLEAINMMIDAGFNPLNQICDATGESMADLYKRISDGKVGFEELQQAVSAATSEGGQFYNGMLEASQTLNGRLSTLQDNVSALLGKLTDGLFTSVSDIVVKLNDLVVSITSSDAKLAALKETIALVITVLVTLTTAMASYKGTVAISTAATTAHTAAVAAMAAAQKAAEGGASGLALAQAALNAVLKANPIGLVVSLLASLAAALVTAYNTSETFRNIVNGAFSAVANVAKSTLGAAIEWVDKLSYRLNKALGKEAYSSYNSYDDYKASKTPAKTNTVTDAERQRRQELHDSRVKQAQELRAEVAKTTSAVTAAASTSSKAVEDASQKSSTAAAKAKKDAASIVSSVQSTDTAIVDGTKVTTQTTTETLSDGSNQIKQVITRTGTEIIDGVEHTVKTVTTIAADGTQTVAKTIEDAGPQFASTGELLTYQLRTSLEDGWQEINNALQTNTLGSIQAVASAIQNGDVAQLGQWAAAIFWHACTEEQKSQIQAIAMEALNRLTTSLQGVGTHLVSLATSLVGRFVPAAGAAATAQAALNTVMDANPILLVVSLIGMLVGALGSFTAANKNTSKGIRSIWSGIGDFMSIIFESLLRVVGVGIEGFVILINGLITAYNAVAWVWGDHINHISNPAWNAANKLKQERIDRKNQLAEAEAKMDSADGSSTATAAKKVIATDTDIHKDTRADGTVVTTKVLTETLQDSAGKITKQVTKTVTESGTKMVDGIERAYKKVTTFVDDVQTKVEQTLEDVNKSSSTTPDPTPTPDPDDSAIRDNTAAILEANKKLAEMVKNANALVLTDNRVIGARVAASGSAQVAAAANNYQREGDTNIVQNIYSKAQTAADLMREARWEADRDKSRKR